MWGSAEPSGWERQEGGRPLRTFEATEILGRNGTERFQEDAIVCQRLECLPGAGWDTGLQCGCSTTWEGGLGKKRLERQWMPWEGLTCVGRRTRLFGWPVESLRLRLDEPPVRLGEQQRRGSGQPRAVGRGREWPGWMSGKDADSGSWGCAQNKLPVRLR